MSSKRKNDKLFYVGKPPDIEVHEENPKEEKAHSFEDVLKKAGLFGPYQIFTCAVIQYVSIEWAGKEIHISFHSLIKIYCANSWYFSMTVDLYCQISNIVGRQKIKQLYSHQL